MLASRVTHVLQAATLPVVRVSYKVDLLIAGALFLGLMAWVTVEDILSGKVK